MGGACGVYLYRTYLGQIPFDKSDTMFLKWKVF